MKKLFNVFLLGVISFGLITTIVNADGVIKNVEDRTYLIEEVTYNCPAAPKGYFIVDYYEKASGEKYFIFAGDFEILMDGISSVYQDLYQYNLKNGTCSKITAEDVNHYIAYDTLNYLNYSRYEWNDKSIYEVKSVYTNQANVLTKDTVAIEGKEYLICESLEGGGFLCDPLSDIEPGDAVPEGTYEEAYFVNNTSFNLDPLKTYYTRGEKGITMVEVVDPKLEDIFDYYLLIDGEPEVKTLVIDNIDFDHFNKTPIDKINITKNMLDRVINIKGKNYLVFGYESLLEENYISFLYSVDGQPVKDKNTNEAIHIKGSISSFINGIFSHNVSDSSFNLMSSNFSNIYKFNLTPFHVIQAVGFDNYTLYVIHNNDDLISKVLKVTTYELDEKLNQKFNGKDLTFKFNGDLDKLIKVKVNNVELDEKNYTKAKGSTIITLNKTYLETLKPGIYTLMLEYSEGTFTSATFQIEEANPPTFDSITTYIMLGTLSLGSLLFIYSKKRFN